MFVNFSNHPSDKWMKEQYEEAVRIGGTVQDLQFPNVPADATEEWIAEKAEECIKQILSLNPVSVMVQGEFTLAYAVSKRLRERNVSVVAACSERNVVEIFENGEIKKIVTFEFVKFRMYE